MENFDSSNQSAVIFSYSGFHTNLIILHWLLLGNYTDANGLVKIVPTHGPNSSIAFANSDAEELSFLITNSDWSQIPND